ncbi:hypothetical protein O6H91_03G059200 [Diphasiastrum complanatum]|uniref:Uncharacterized protein n=1 Tax=Diphasiastrum complanatum TaxID=34168 RepID=A0ACC2E6S0_DIPCM|nr:hypothetical protein O6H91_03G059200 [Diphasiastrum complanatum]
MKAIVIREPGGPEVLELREVADPEVHDGEVLIKIAAAGVNRADTSQRKGQYPPPPGAPVYLGLECSGVIEAVGSGVENWKVGDEVCALLTGGGYAEKVAVSAGQLLPIPKGISLQDAASLSEAACTVWSTIFMTSHLSFGESLLIHGGTSGIGTFAIQIAKYIGAKVFTTAGSDESLLECSKLGADVTINYKKEDFVARVKDETNDKAAGVDVILDIIGASYFQRNLDSLSLGGRLFIIGFQTGLTGQFNLGPLLVKRLTVSAAGLRSRSTENKAQIVAEVLANVWPAIEEGKVKPIIYKSLPLENAAEAHHLIEGNHLGKILLIP